MPGRAFLFISSVLLMAPTVFAQDATDTTIAASIRKICEPPLIYAATNSSTFTSDRNYQRDWFNYICSITATSLEEARQQGVSVDTVIDGVPLGAMWSDDSVTRRTARNKFCSLTTDTTRSRDLVQLTQRAGNAEAIKSYNQCVLDATANLMNGQPLSCRFSETGMPDSLILRVEYIKRTADPDPTVLTAQLGNGRIDPPLLYDPSRFGAGPTRQPRFLDVGGRMIETGTASLPITGAVLTPGSRLFIVRKPDLRAPTSIVINTSNGLTCTNSQNSAIRVDITATITPVGRNIVPLTRTAVIDRTADCNGKIVDDVRICLPESSPVENVSVVTGSVAGGSFVSQPVTQGCSTLLGS